MKRIFFLPPPPEISLKARSHLLMVRSSKSANSFSFFFSVSRIFLNDVSFSFFLLVSRNYVKKYLKNLENILILEAIYFMLFTSERNIAG